MHADAAEAAPACQPGAAAYTVLTMTMLAGWADGLGQGGGIHRRGPQSSPAESAPAPQQSAKPCPTHMFQKSLDFSNALAVLRWPK